MRQAFEEVLRNLFDYAGTFPPESLSFDAALQTSACLRETLRRPWLVAADFVVPFADLSRLSVERLRGLGFASFRCAVLGAQFAGSEDTTRAELQELAVFNAESPSRLAVSYEIPMRQDAGVESLVEVAGDAPGGVRVYVEPDLTGDAWRETLTTTVGALRAARHHVGLKVRGGGAGAIDSRKLAAVIDCYAALQIDLKVTAGMHHPIREPDRYGQNLGFLNAAAALLMKRHFESAFPEQETLRCLEESDPGAFTTDDGFGWDGFRLTAIDTMDLRAHGRFAVGSCSIREPDDDLVRLFGPPDGPPPPHGLSP